MCIPLSSTNRAKVNFICSILLMMNLSFFLIYIEMFTLEKTVNLQAKRHDVQMEQAVFHCDTKLSPVMVFQLLYNSMLMVHLLQQLHRMDVQRFVDVVELKYKGKKKTFNTQFNKTKWLKVILKTNEQFC